MPTDTPEPLRDMRGISKCGWVLDDALRMRAVLAQAGEQEQAG